MHPDVDQDTGQFLGKIQCDASEARGSKQPHSSLPVRLDDQSLWPTLQQVGNGAAAGSSNEDMASRGTSTSTSGSQLGELGKTEEESRLEWKTRIRQQRDRAAQEAANVRVPRTDSRHTGVRASDTASVQQPSHQQPFRHAPQHEPHPQARQHTQRPGEQPSARLRNDTRPSQMSHSRLSRDSAVGMKKITDDEDYRCIPCIARTCWQGCSKYKKDAAGAILIAFGSMFRTVGSASFFGSSPCLLPQASGRVNSLCNACKRILTQAWCLYRRDIPVRTSVGRGKESSAGGGPAGPSTLARSRPSVSLDVSLLLRVRIFVGGASWDVLCIH